MKLLLLASSAAAVRLGVKTKVDLPASMEPIEHPFAAQPGFRLDHHEALLGEQIEQIITVPPGAFMLEDASGNPLPSNEIDALESFDWALEQNVVGPALNQEGCGSCWAFAAAGVLESALAIESGFSPREFRISEQQLLDCAPDPNDCGGVGGCKGSTPGLGFEYWKNNGVRLVGDATSKDDKDFAYIGKDEKVAKQLCEANSTAGDVTLTSYAQVANNDLVSLMFAIREFGPAAVAVDAKCFSGYDGGIVDYEKCGTTLNHAVLAVGYGKDVDTGKCWLKIRNSWGPQWGECRDHTTKDCAEDDRGFIRIERQCLLENAISAPKVCAMDTSTKDGLGCIGAKQNLHPRNTMVCGTAGVLYKPLVVTGAHFAEGFTPKLKDNASQQDTMKAKCAKQGMIVDVASCNKNGCKCTPPPTDASECTSTGALAQCLEPVVSKYCFGEDSKGAPGCQNGKLATGGIYARCGKEAHACAVCYPASPCGAKA